MDLIKAYDAVNAILDTVDFNSLFKGFHKYRFALYSSKEVVIDGRSMPYSDNFRGNTCIEYEGEFIAIWNMEFDRVEDSERLAYCLVHEMFHCHQRANNENRYPSDFELLNYPEDTDNFTKKYNENLYLADAYEQRDVVQLRKFACIRKSRLEKYPSMVSQELKTETLEGMAEYMGLKALKLINSDKYNAVIGNYLDRLREESNLLFDVRRISYFTGTIFFLCLDAFGFSVNNAFDSNLTAYEQNVIDTEGINAEIKAYGFIQSNYEKLTAERKAKIEEHIKRSQYVECNAFICGYDPMNMFRVGNLIHCSHFVFLSENGKTKVINSAVTLKLAEGSNQTIVGYYA